MKIIDVSGDAFHLPGNDIDTDRIIPAAYMRCVTFDGLEDHVFENDRNQLKGAHPFDLPLNNGCPILIVDENFGCGSSREHAVAAIQRWGIKAIIGLSFATIFRGNATANGLVCVDVDPTIHAHIIHIITNSSTKQLSIDLTRMKIEIEIPRPHGDYADGDNDTYKSHTCIMPSADADMLVTGRWDTTATLLEAGDLIEATAARLPYMQKT